jgi:Domain of unknown function (4846)
MHTNRHAEASLALGRSSAQRGLRLARLFILAVLGACSTSEARSEQARSPGATTSAASGVLGVTQASAVAPATAPAASSSEPLPPVLAVYPWRPRSPASALGTGRSNTSAGGGAGPDDNDRLDGRFRRPPAGFTRVSVARGSFGEFLRSLPLQPEGSPVVDFRGKKLHADGHHPNIVAVADIDVGAKDLQHCADAILRLHAEWRYGLGDRDISYRSVSGQPLSYRAHLAGERARIDGKNLVMERSAPARKDDHAVFRGWLDDVFSWAGTASLERDAKKVPSASELMPGDFFVMSGTPFGHAVLVLDVARDERGRAAILLGQSYMPAQSFQVLARDRSAWFVVEPGDAFVSTPFWKPFSITSLRRF